MKKIISTVLALVTCLMLSVPAMAAANSVYGAVPGYTYAIGPWISGYPYYYTTAPNGNNASYVVRPWEGNSAYVSSTGNYIYGTWVPRGLSNFQRSRAYAAGTYKDVPAGAWYETGVKTLYEMGLLTEGKNFRPAGNLTLAEVVSLAARIHSIYNGWPIPGDMTDLQYALNMGIVEQDQYSNYNALATRRSFAAIMAKALPSEALRGITTVMDGAIPDVAPYDPGAAGIYTLYRAGVLQGGDGWGNFYPNERITRASAAVIMARMLDTTQRRGATLFAPQATSISLDQTAMTMYPGQVRSMTAYVYPANTPNRTVTWTTSDPAVALVDAYGTVTAMRPGNAVIIATNINGAIATCAVSVTSR